MAGAGRQPAGPFRCGGGRGTSGAAETHDTASGSRLLPGDLSSGTHGGGAGGSAGTAGGPLLPQRGPGQARRGAVFVPAENGYNIALTIDVHIQSIVERYLKEAVEKHVFGTKMRSVIYEPNVEGIKAIVAQQFEFAKQICDAGLVPIIEPEVDINAPEKEKCEEILKSEVKKQLDSWNEEDKIMFKFTIPTVANHYLDLYDYSCVVRIVALSGGYDVDKAVELLAQNNRMIASFSRALLQDLNVHQTQEEFDKKLNDVIVKIYNASIS